MTKVIAVILTYNRKELLRQCLDAVYSQTTPCDQVFVIDNASTDGTQDMLEDMPYPDLLIHRLSQNLGAAGGFNIGFRLAYQHGADFVWMMDDDVIPKPTALQRLLEANALLKTQEVEYSYLLSTAFTEGGLVTNTPEVSHHKNRIGYHSWPLLAEHGLVAVSRGTFVSILVPRLTLETSGLPILSMFIWGEDAEFTLRITKTAPGFLVGASQVLHVRQGSGSISILSEDNPARFKYYKHFIRNNIYMAKQYRPFHRRVSVLLRYLRMAFTLLGRGQYQKARVVMQGLMASMYFAPHLEAAGDPVDASLVSIQTFTPSASSQQKAMTDVDSLA
ncbi:glycosyltransferase family 2 protein [Halomonas cerina]|uniref:dTDP-4-dehydrorhamnose reductase n=1 Tax=Halomonas cerina TaxID=447424 RepID=A0A839V0V8_9GAMM|nr:glycosyltransferase family 2 protein [Halomonas cerina]MBB3189393.1 dTDP-4-dehydrorhamnose reductase [Halomonas cerina]